MNNIHFIAIGGAIMHQLALALHHKGYTITGSDDEITDPAKSNLAAAGILPTSMGWHPERITGNLDAIVLGMHARDNNPELLKAKELGIPVYSFPQYIYEVSKDKKRVVVAGSHGKTTITSMIMHILKSQGLAFDYMVGSRVPGFAQSVQLTDAPIIVLEGDEYPASAEEKRPKIFFYHPDIAVISGIAWDHINVFPTYENYFSQFTTFIGMMRQGATLLYNAEDMEVVKAVQAAGSQLHTMPYTTPTFSYDNGNPVMNVNGHQLKFSVFGRHNMLNMQAAVAVCAELGVPIADAFAALTTFTGAARRLEQIKATPRLLAYRDFAHAPSKLKATLDAVREAYPDRKLVACFELHTFSSLNEKFLSEYAHTMDAADEAMVFFSGHALELKGLPALDKQKVGAFFERADLTVWNNSAQLYDAIRQSIQKAEQPVFLLLMSSGTFDGIDWGQLE